VAQRSLLQLRTQAREVADQAGTATSRFVADARLNEWINAAYAALYSKLVALFEDYFLTFTNLTLVGGTDTYSLAAVTPLIYKLRGVDRIWSGSADDFTSLKRFEWSERGRFANTPAHLTRAGETPNYCYTGSSLVFKPTPNAGGTVKVWYAPQVTLLVADGDVISAEIKESWEQFIVLRAAYRLMMKEQNPDAKNLLTDLAMIEADILASAPNRDAEQAEMMTTPRRDREEMGEDWRR